MTISVIRKMWNLVWKIPCEVRNENQATTSILVNRTEAFGWTCIRVERSWLVNLSSGWFVDIRFLPSEFVFDWNDFGRCNCPNRVSSSWNSTLRLCFYVTCTQHCIPNLFFLKLVSNLVWTCNIVSSYVSGNCYTVDVHGNWQFREYYWRDERWEICQRFVSSTKFQKNALC